MISIWCRKIYFFVNCFYYYLFPFKHKIFDWNIFEKIFFLYFKINVRSQISCVRACVRTWVRVFILYYYIYFTCFLSAYSFVLLKLEDLFTKSNDILWIIGSLMRIWSNICKLVSRSCFFEKFVYVDITLHCV